MSSNVRKLFNREKLNNNIGLHQFHDHIIHKLNIKSSGFFTSKYMTQITLTPSFVYIHRRTMCILLLKFVWNSVNKRWLVSKETLAKIKRNIEEGQELKEEKERESEGGENESKSGVCGRSRIREPASSCIGSVWYGPRQATVRWVIRRTKRFTNCVINRIKLTDLFVHTVW